jgi:hypothetical protein
VAALIPRQPPGTLARVKAQEPRPVGPDRRFGSGNNDGRNGTWVHAGQRRPGTSLEEKAPKGESQERCRYETRPAQARRE